MREDGETARRERNKDREGRGERRGTETRFVILGRAAFACYGAEHTCSYKRVLIYFPFVLQAIRLFLDLPCIKSGALAVSGSLEKDNCSSK